MRFEKLQGPDTIKLQHFSQLKASYLTITEGSDPVTGKPIYVDCDIAGTDYRMNAGRKAAETHDAGVRLAEQNGETETFIVDFTNQVHYAVPIAVAKHVAMLQAIDARGYYIQYQTMKQQIAGASTVAELRALSQVFTVNTL